MKIQTLTSFFGLSQGAFYGNAYGNYMMGSPSYQRPVQNGYIPIVNNLQPRPIPTHVSPKPKKPNPHGERCDKVFTLGRGDQEVLKSPHYPQDIDPQTQCMWTVEGPPGSRIRIDFEDFRIWKTGRGCETAFLKISAEGSFKLCGKNPGYLIAPTNSISMLLQSDIGKVGAPSTEKKGFILRLSVTREPAYFPTIDGKAVFDGRIKGKLATPVRVVAPVEVVAPTRNSQFASRDIPAINPVIGPPRIFQAGRIPSPPRPVERTIFPASGAVGQISGRNQPDSYSTSGSDKIKQDGDNRVQNMAIIAVTIGLTLSAVLGFVAFKMWRRHKSGSNQEDEK